MATLNTLLVNANSVNGTRNWNTNMDYTNIDETIAGADAAAIIDNTNGSTSQVASFLLSAVNADLGNIDTLSWQIRYRVNGAQINTRNLYVRIVRESDGTVLAANTSGGAFQLVEAGVSNTTFSNSTVTGFNYVNTSANKTAWNDARIEFQNTVSKYHGGDSNGMEIDTVEITGTYTIYVGADFTKLKVNVGDVWKDGADGYINVADVWKKIEAMWVNVGDTWKQIM